MVLCEPFSSYNSTMKAINLFLPPELLEQVRVFAKNAGIDEEQALISLLTSALSQELPAPSEPATRSPGSSSADSLGHFAAPDHTDPQEGER